VAETAILTFADCIDALADFARMSGGVSVAIPALKRCVLAAYDEVAAAHDWRSLKQMTRINLRKPQTAGTVSYNATTRELTLTGATWPSWSQDASVRIDGVLHDVDTVKTTTVLTLDSVMCPADDITDASYVMFPRWYLLPLDFEALATPMDEPFAWGLGEYISPDAMAQLMRYEDETGDPRFYSIQTADGIYGALALSVWPASDKDRTYDVLYRRKPRALRHSGKEPGDYVGSVSTTAGDASIAGASTAFTDTMQGAIIRLIGATTIKALPTGWDGAHPRIEERSISSVASATVATADSAFANTLAGAAYVVSDPIDLHSSAHAALMACAIKHLARRLRLKDYAVLDRAAQQAIQDAKSLDGGRVHQRRVAGATIGPVTRLAHATNRPQVY
jgi:hypothetical protein